MKSIAVQRTECVDVEIRLDYDPKSWVDVHVQHIIFMSKIGPIFTTVIILRKQIFAQRSHEKKSPVFCSACIYKSDDASKRKKLLLRFCEFSNIIASARNHVTQIEQKR